MSGAELAARRKAMHLTQDALAEELGVDVMTVSRWERETRGTPDTLLDLALRQLERLSPEPPLRVPHGYFEIGLFAWVIRAQLEEWSTFGLRGLLGTYQGEGIWALTVEQDVERTWESLFPPQVTGRVWIESGMTPVPRVCWSIPPTEYGPAEYGSLGDAPHLWLSQS